MKEIVPVKGVPFLKETRNNKLVRLLERTDSRVIVETENHSLDVPYADCFRVCENWTCISTSKTQNKCIFR